MGNNKFMTTLTEERGVKDTYLEHDLHFLKPDRNCSDCHSELPDCRYTDCRGDGKVHHGGSLNVCDKCTSWADGFDIGN